MLKPRQIFKFIISLTACLIAGVFGAVFTTNDSINTWYAQLKKPFFTPPDFLFAPVWTILYLLMGISAFLIWRKGLTDPKTKKALGLFLVQLALNALWTPLFFRFHLILAAFLEIILLWVIIFATFKAFKRISKPASIILIPYLFWVGYAVILNGSIFYLNQRQDFFTCTQKPQYALSKGEKMRPENKPEKHNELTPEEQAVITYKGTEKPFSGIYCQHKQKGLYTCKRCDAPLFNSDDKFDSGCGWPSFDDAIPNAVKQIPDNDRVRTEIICNNCDAHLGHVFTGENLTKKNIRHCVNSISLNFISAKTDQNYPNAYFAGGCFWGVEYFFQDQKGVVSTQVGYMGGTKANPTYQQVCDGNTSHAETLEVTYDPNLTDFETLAKIFFEIHDPTQINRQGPDIGDQYRSAIFYTDDKQRQTAQNLIDVLKKKGYKIVTQLVKADKFYKAEDYHQRYYQKNKKTPYCHMYQKKF